MKALMRNAALVLCLGAVGCVDVEDKPSRVHDFRVLGLATERPELMAPTCEDTPAARAAFAEEVTFRALLVDPVGEGRAIHYTLWACADPEDETCEEAADRVPLTEGSTNERELALRVRLGDLTVADGTRLLERVREKDPYKGFGGLRMPLVLHARAGEEEVYAQKLMVFNCPRVPGMVANVLPVLPGLLMEEAAWAADAVPELKGRGPFVVKVADLAGLQEDYVVPGLRQESVALREAWRVSWHTTLGEFTPEETGGMGLGDAPGRHRTEWEPPEEADTAQDVRFWAVVRDGRGGESWVSRRAHWSP
ncbi:hypothetical protein SAMN05444354_103431 [Stigmatella aurantiaca]|uniref:Lipoprotein n=1 Tax=Stigmatella aurantiaca TaxID=41 RepID=A0A1H7M507_STIAU|nr:hypothetical protein [Stigmatella aurantiaca]SEL06189.1 hypothetical protein SAMN05444354_103431 [Stigmatella aurantiaca]